MQRLAKRGYRGLTFSAAVLDDHPGRIVAITFDDAYPSVAEHALPVLRELGWPATVFVPTATAASGGLMTWLSPDFAAEKRQLSWPELTDLAEAGWEIGSHSRTHRLLSTLDEAELQEELEGFRAEIVAHLGSCTSIGYPWGEVDNRVVEGARRAGYTVGSGLAKRFVHDDPLRSPRVPIAGLDGRVRFALKTSGLLWTLRSTPPLGRPRNRPRTRQRPRQGTKGPDGASAVPAAPPVDLAASDRDARFPPCPFSMWSCSSHWPGSCLLYLLASRSVC